MALFCLLLGLKEQYRWKLSVIHFNHQLRTRGGKKDEAFVRRMSKKARIRFYSGTGNVLQKAKQNKASIEEWARKMRYDFFIRTARTQKISKIVFAHTQDDQAETVLMRILQGTGLRGLSGIREKNNMGRVSFIRPLLIFTKSELLAFLKEQNIPFCHDRSNRSMRFLRNRIRLKLIPMLAREYNPRLVEALSRIPAIACEETQLFSDLELTAWREVFKRQQKKRIEFKRSAFLKYPSPLQFRVLERALKKLDPRSGLSFEAWQRIRRELHRSLYRCSLPRDIDFAVSSKKIMVYKKYA